MTQRLMRAAFAIPGDLNAPTGGYAYARAVLAEWKHSGFEVEHIALPGGFPHPSVADLTETAALLRRPADVWLIDGLAYGAMPESLIAGIEAPIVALTHHPLAYETGMDAETSKRLFASEKAALAGAAHVVVTSRTTAETLMADFAAPPDKITVAEPGTEPAARATGGDPPHILAVGTVSARKGYDVLIAALALIRDAPWRCTIAGALDRDRAAAASVCAAIHHEELAARVKLAGAVSQIELGALYASADIFALASRYEGYGMAYAEAMARGLPIVACAGGASAATVPPQAGILVSPDDAPAFAAALRRMLEPKTRRHYADGAWSHGQTLPRWSDTAAKIAAVLKEAAR